MTFLEICNLMYPHRLFRAKELRRLMGKHCNKECKGEYCDKKQIYKFCNKLIESVLFNLPRL